MNKNKEKYHLAEEIRETVKGSDKPADAHHQAVQETPVKQELKPAVELPETEKLAKAEQEIDQFKDQLLRLRADFDNYRKRSLREKGEIYENANEALMLELLPVIDHLQLAINSAKEHKANAAFQDGLQLIADQLMTALAKYGLNPFNSGKQPFDANLHEAISCLPSETEPEGTIITQSRPGYRFKNKMLRPAQVVVSGGKPCPPQSEANNQQPAED